MKVIRLIVLIFAIILPTLSRAAAVDSTVVTMRKAAPAFVRVGTSAVVNIALTEILKSSVHQMRPDRSDNDSWPSRHTSWAFTAASIAAHEFYDDSGWCAVGSHAIGDAVMMQRIYSGNHFPKDVIAGALVGLLSTEIGYAVGDLLFPGSRKPLPKVYSDWIPGLDVTTTAIFPLNGGAKGYESGTGVLTSLRLNLPFSEKWGFASALNFRSMPMYLTDKYMSMVNSTGLSLGVMWRSDLSDSRFAFESRLMPGFTKNFDADNVPHPSWSFTVDLSGGVDYRLTEDFSVGAEIGYSYWALRRGQHSINAGIYTRVMF